MKCRELSQICDRLRAGIEAFGGSPRGLGIFAAVLAAKPDLTANQLAKALQHLSKLETSQQNDISDIRETISVLLGMFSSVAKPAAIADLKVLHAAFEQHDASNATALINALNAKVSPSKALTVPAREDVVRKYAAALESRLGDDPGFTAIFKSLENDSEVQQAEAIALAKRFAFASAKTRAAALKKIWSRHQSLMISRAKSAATAGRIAG